MDVNPAMLKTRSYDMPPRRTNGAGAIRGVGVEVEFSSLGVEAAALALHRALGGDLAQEDAFAFKLKGTRIGDLDVKLDSRFAHKEKEARSEESLLDVVGGRIGEWFASIAEPIIPCELVTGPIPLDDLAMIDEAVDALRNAGAEGAVKDGMTPLALHLNPEIPDTSPETVAALIKAFALMDAWLRHEHDPDRLRKLMAYFQPYPEAYVEMVSDPAYWPPMGRLIDDYLEANPSRDRDLDMLPLLRFIDEERVVNALPDEKIGRRPTSHYRLPDSRVGDPDWSVANVWNRWVAVERLADDRATLDALGMAYRDGSSREDWVATVERLVLGRR
ncbi:amidoligase family protein [Acuticoccus sp. M5D2P5]|uniref:amidoligase family protein n=1 Tax=Acuticoccus kalidii TaxID=2910977 RepID=UPI001F21AB67|nr:amidoligase family protein [Acuticoccus kalidii]MCF3936698.1 amidoligase family protein [Acuticoccus kalidii]